MESWSSIRRGLLVAIALVALVACQGRAATEQVAEGSGGREQIADGWDGGEPTEAAVGTPTPPIALQEEPPFVLVADDLPVAWSACDPIRWAFAPGRTSLAAQEAIQGGVERILDLAGLQSRFEGVIHGLRPAADDQSHDMVVQVVAHETTDLLSREEWGRTQLSRRGLHWTSATISLSEDGIGVLDAQNAAFSWRTLAMHEVGHAVGLSHTTETDSLMYPVLELAAAAPSEEDLAALELLRAAATCPG